MDIFASTAPHYYKKGMPVIPLKYHDKMPLITNWSAYSTLPVPEEQQRLWIQHQPQANIGLVLGEQSRVCMLDIDTDNEEIMGALMACIPESPWHRRGKKGLAIAFKYTGHKTFRVRDLKQNTICELLSQGTQVVLPPSIHPDTKAPYVANSDLYEVVDELPELSVEIESLLRGALIDLGVNLSTTGWSKLTDWTSVGSRDVRMTSVAGFYARAVTRGEMPLVEAMQQIKVWKEMHVEHVAGDDVDVEKGIRNIVQFLIRDVVEKGKMLPTGWDEGLDDEERKRLGLTFTEEHEEWTYEQMKDYLQSSFEQHPERSPARHEAVMNILQKIAKAVNLDKVSQERLLKFITLVGADEGYSVASLKAGIKDCQTKDFNGRNHTEIAQAVIAEFEKVSPIAHHGSRFWTWGGSHWEKLSDQRILQRIAEDFGSMDAAKRSADHRGIKQIMANLVPQKIQEQSIKGVNFANGIVTEGGVLLPHDPSYGMTYTLPFRYVPDEARKADRFFKLLEDCWGHTDDYEERMQALQEAMCVTMFGWGPTYQRAILLYGVPKSGKSQLLRVVEALIPDEARAFVAPHEWSDKFLPAELHEKLLNVCGELSQNRVIEGARFKSIVCGEEMVAEHKGLNPFTFRPKCTHWFASNHLPRTSDTSSAFNRRWLILPFDRPVSAEGRIPNLGDLIVAEEREAIAAWAIRALERLREQREFTLPRSHKVLIEEVAFANDSIRHFVLGSGKVRLEPVPPGIQSNGSGTYPSTSEAQLHSAYYFFCKTVEGVRPVSSRRFRTGMRELASELGFKMALVPGSNGVTDIKYIGLTLVDGTGV